MKKYFCLVVTLIMLIAVASCKAEVDLSYYVSELRENVYVCETEGLKVTVYSEKRESPYIADGYVGTLKDVLIVKIDSESVKIDDAEISLNYDKTSVKGSFTYSSINGKYVCQIEVQSLPKSDKISGEIKCGENSFNLELSSGVLTDTISAKQALESVKKHDSKTLEKLFENGKVQTEIHVRIMADGERNYYYVGFVCSDGTYAYLVDGKTGEVLARKNTPKRN